MRRIAFLFPGQGAQEVGMGRDLFERDPFSARLIEAAGDAAGADLKTLCIKGSARRLAQTENLQPALAAVCLGLSNRLIEAGVQPVVTAGHSLGELPALATGGMVESEQVVRLAAVRGRLMADAAASQPGGMVAVTGLPLDDLRQGVDAYPAPGVLSIGAVNAPDQATLTGDPDCLEEAGLALGRQAGVRVKPLRVSGAWHSSHMGPAVEPFRQALREIDWQAPTVPLVFNRTGLEAPVEQVPDLIAEQLVNPVRWDLVMQRLFALEITDFVEIGPGRVLRGLVRLNTRDPAIRVHNVSDLRSLDRTVKVLG
jgi:[acyl-carrier-protein] S-malonyltransferase